MLPFHSASICCWHFMMPYRSLFLSNSHGYKCFSLEDSIFTSCIKDYCINVVRFCIFSLYTPKLRTHRWKQHFAKKIARTIYFHHCLPTVGTKSCTTLEWNWYELVFEHFYTQPHVIFYTTNSITVAFQQYFL